MCGQRIQMGAGLTVASQATTQRRVGLLDGVGKIESETGGTMKKNDESEDYRFSVRLLLKHPSRDLTEVAEHLGFGPSVMHVAGAQRRTPAGKPLSGVYKASMWSYTWEFFGTRFFFGELSSILRALSEKRKFFIDLTTTGGSASVIVNLPGDAKIGDELTPDVLMTILGLNVTLGVEVFPNYT
jgi:hypothetical protein